MAPLSIILSTCQPRHRDPPRLLATFQYHSPPSSNAQLLLKFMHHTNHSRPLPLMRPKHHSHIKTISYSHAYYFSSFRHHSQTLTHLNSKNTRSYLTIKQLCTDTSKSSSNKTLTSFPLTCSSHS